mgnify:CR=1 FL=1
MACDMMTLSENSTVSYISWINSTATTAAPLSLPSYESDRHNFHFVVNEPVTAASIHQPSFLNLPQRTVTAYHHRRQYAYQHLGQFVSMIFLA